MPMYMDQTTTGRHQRHAGTILEHQMDATHDLEDVMAALKDRTPNEPEFHQAVREVLQDVLPYARSQKLTDDAIIERLIEPDRIISFRIVWEDDNQRVRVNRGYRVQFNSAIGPYKGGLRFHPSVNQSVLKFLAFEQTFKNALTGLPMGGGKGGADFNPRGRSEREIMRFCNAFMTELHRHIGPDVDVPAGDINVGSREIGYLFGAYRRITNEFESSLTGKGIAYGGSEMRTEATGFGLLHFVCHMLEAHDMSVKDKTVVISGAGNVATHAAEKAISMGAKVVTLSDSGGFIHDPGGLTAEKLEWVRRHKSTSGASLSAYVDKFKAEWHDGKRPWNVACDIALPCATQNELDDDAAKSLIDNGCRAIAEGANMPTTVEALDRIRHHKLLFAPAKAANAGGVAVSGLEISQNQSRRPRKRDEISKELHEIMRDIHSACFEHGKDTGGTVDYARGANIASFAKVTEAMRGQGLG